MTSGPAEFNFTGVQLVVADASDCATLATLARRTHTHPWSEQQYRDSMDAGHQSWLLLSDKGEPIGYCVISQLFDEAEILDIAVVPEWRRRGLAQALLQRLISELPTAITRILLEVRASNFSARELYRKLGFVEDGLRRGYYPGENGVREDAVLMSLDL